MDTPHQSSTDPNDSIDSSNAEMERRAATPANNLVYVVAVVAMMLIGVTAAVAITVFRPSDVGNSGLIITIFGFLAPTTLSLLTFMKSQETHLSVNSRLDGFMRNASFAARAQGRNEGRIAAGIAAATVHEVHMPVPAIIKIIPTTTDTSADNKP